MDRLKNIKIILGSIYILIICIFLWFFFKNFSLDEFSSYSIIKSNLNTFNQVKDSNIVISSIIFFFITILWVLLLGFGTPIFLIGGFIFGKWIGSIIVIFGLTTGATLLYIMANFLLKDLIRDKFYAKFSHLIEKFKKNELFYFIIYRAIGGIPFFIQNLIPTLFNITIKNYFFGSLIGLAPQLFIGVSLGAGLNDVLEKNENLPTLIELLSDSSIYLPILAIILIFLVGFFSRKSFFGK